MRPALAGLFALTTVLGLAPEANAAMQVRCNWEGRIPVAITVEADVDAFLPFSPFVSTGYYQIEFTNSATWMLLNTPKPVLSIQMVGPGKPIDLALALDARHARCWR